MKPAILDYNVFKQSADYINLAGFSTWAKFFTDYIIMPKNTGTFRTYDSLRSEALCHAVFKCKLDANMGLVRSMRSLEIPQKAVNAVRELVKRHFLKELKLFGLKLKMQDAKLINPADEDIDQAMAIGKEIIDNMPKALDDLFKRQVHICWITGITGIVQKKKLPDKLKIYSSISADMSKSFGHDIPGIEFGGLTFDVPIAMYNYPVVTDYITIKKGINKMAVDTFPKADWNKSKNESQSE